MDQLPVFVLLSVSALLLNVHGELMDLTHDVDSNALYWPIQKGFQLNVTMEGALPPVNVWFRQEEYSSGTHVGTHMDAPLHFKDNGWSIADIPFERFIAPAVFIDIREKVAITPDTGITLDDVKAYELKYGTIPRGACVFMCSGWSDRYYSRALSFGNDRDDTTDVHFPGFDLEPVQWLVENRGIVGIATDAMSFDRGQNDGFPVHVYTAAHDIYGLENVKDTCKAPPSGTTAYILPSKFKGSGGAPARVVLQWNTPENAAPGVLCSVSAISLCFLFFVLLDN